MKQTIKIAETDPMDKKLFWAIVIVGVALVGGWLGYSLWYSPQPSGVYGQNANAPKGESLRSDSAISLTNLKRGDTLASGFVLKGSAPDGWFKDGSFPVFLSDSKGNIIAQTFANVVGAPNGSGLVNFESPIFFSKPDTKEGILLFANVGLEGLPDNLDDLKEVLKIEVSF